ncbi:MAG: peroxiredoxin-like family protein [Cetobacterium sp.]|uniref:peroxiredoxin-like family protein n=1 Tax=unclassified Cetobacterium TaxID=2630983 RepID=UPI000646CF4E|nr:MULTISPECIES: peroxiredoxin-like family protein [unclassified Cetobacterium]
MEILEKKLAERREATKERVAPETLTKMLKATQNLKNEDVEKRAFNVGDKIENSKLLNSLSEEVELVKILDNKPSIISFYRGTWCPYCNLELAAYNKILQNKKEVNMIAISPEKPDSSVDTANLNFKVFSDINNELAKKLNLAFDITETIEEVYKGFGIDLEESQGNKDRILPIPATYIVNSSREIVYAYIDADYTKRAEPKEVIEKYLEIFNL